MSSRPAPPLPDIGPHDPLRPVEEAVLEHLFELSPGYAVFLGIHGYDGRMPDLTRPATDAWLDKADRLIRQLQDPALGALPPARRFDRTLLELLLESPVFDLRDCRDLDRNPMSYVGGISLTPYMIRAYAPVPSRVAAMRRVLEGVPWLLETGRRRLDAKLPEPFVRLALAMGSGLKAHFEEAEQFARSAGSGLGDQVAGARPAAEKAVEEFLERLKTDYLPNAVPEFALGPERYQRLLWVREGSTTPTAEILAAGRADLARNQRRLAEIATKLHPGIPVPEAIRTAFEALFVRHATADRLVTRAQEYVDEARTFMLAKELVTLPEPAVCRVQETPIYGRALSTASMNPPGPFDVAGDEGIYFVTPVDPEWTKDRQEEWLRSLNDSMLRNITVHEVYPGHYLQFLHFRRTASTLARSVFLSASFSEGWAHYTEQLAIEAGLGAGSDDAELAQIHDALLRDCRLIASIGLHTQGWSLAQATELFQKEAHFEALPAEREAIRGTFNPEYFCYTLGKLAILEARRKLLSGKFNGSLKHFHDALLGHGCPPVGVLESLLAGA